MEKYAYVANWKRGKIVKVYPRWAWEVRALIQPADGGPRLFLGAHQHCGLEEQWGQIRYNCMIAEELKPRLGQQVLYYPTEKRNKYETPYVHVWVTLEEFVDFTLGFLQKRL